MNKHPNHVKIFAIDDWAIVKTCEAEHRIAFRAGEPYVLEHICPSVSATLDDSLIRVYRRESGKLNFPCSFCKSVPSDGIQTIYRLYLAGKHDDD